MPFIGGQLFSIFKNHYTTYHYLFWWQLILSMVCAVIFATVPEPLPPGAHIFPAECVGANSSTSEACAVPNSLITVMTTCIYLAFTGVEPPRDHSTWRYRAPIGARLCDQLCFKRTVRALSSPAPLTGVDAAGTVEDDRDNEDTRVGVSPT